MSEPVLSLRTVSRVHGSGAGKVIALHALDLDVRAGELVAVMGPSGSGKSTLLHLSGGLYQPSSGAVLVEGRSLGGMSKNALAAVRRRAVGYVFQDFNLVPALTVAENVALPLELDGLRAKAARAKALVALEELEIAGRTCAALGRSASTTYRRDRVAASRRRVDPGRPAHRARLSHLAPARCTRRRRARSS
jgi:putative ABC transport system ATP-binding protein